MTTSTQPGLETRSLADHAGKVWDRVVVGSGISRLSTAGLLRERGDSVLLLKKESGSGGLVRCTREADNVLYHRVGGHVFNTRIPAVAEWFWSQLITGVNSCMR